MGRPRKYASDAERQRSYRERIRKLLERARTKKASANRQNWETPAPIFEEYDRRFNFDLDPCCDFTNAKLGTGQHLRIFTEEDDGLALPWTPSKAVWVNPPYKDAAKWVEKAYREWLGGGMTIVMLLPMTNTKWFREIVLPNNAKIEPLPKRIHFIDPDTGKPSKNAAPFSSMICIFHARSD